MKRLLTWRLLGGILGIVLVAGLAGCGGSNTPAGNTSAANTSTASAPAVKLAPTSALPDFAKSAPASVQEAYRYAIANQNYLANFPCYCGCGAQGHKSNLQCYIKGTNPDGSLVFDDHAFG